MEGLLEAGTPVAGTGNDRCRGVYLPHLHQSRQGPGGLGPAAERTAGAITTHTPDACYPGAGYTLGNAEKFELKYGAGQRAEFQTAVASRNGANPSYLRLYWAWRSSQGWSAPEDARWALAAEPMLSKLYVVRETVGAKIAPKDDPCDGFMTLLLPALDSAMSDPTKQPAGTRTSVAPE